MILIVNVIYFKGENNNFFDYSEVAPICIWVFTVVSGKAADRAKLFSAAMFCV